MPRAKIVRASPARRGRPRLRKPYSMGKMLKYSLTPVSNKPHLFKRLGQKTIIYVNGAGTIAYSGSDTGFAISAMTADQLTGCYQFGWSHTFSLNNVLGTTDFTNLFDRYKITGVKYKIMFQCNTAAVQGSQVLPILHYVKDEDDNNIPSSLNDINQKQLCKVKVMGATTMISYFVKPKVAKDIYQSAIATSYAVEKAPYINSTYATTPHYGIKAWMNQVYAVAANNTAVTIEPVYYIACRDPQ